MIRPLSRLPVRFTSKPLDGFSMFHLGIIGKPSTHVSGIGDVAPCGLLKEVELANHTTVVETPVKGLRVLVASQQLAASHGDVLEGRVLICQAKIVQDGLNQLRLCQSEGVTFLVNVDSKNVCKSSINCQLKSCFCHSVNDIIHFLISGGGHDGIISVKNKNNIAMVEKTVIDLALHKSNLIEDLAQEQIPLSPSILASIDNLDHFEKPIPGINALDLDAFGNVDKLLVGDGCLWESLNKVELSGLPLVDEDIDQEQMDDGPLSCGRVGLIEVPSLNLVGWLVGKLHSSRC